MKKIFQFLILIYAVNGYAVQDTIKCNASDRSLEVLGSFDRSTTEFELNLKVGEFESDFYSRILADNSRLEENAKGNFIVEGGLKVITMSTQTLEVGPNLVKITMVATPSTIQSRNTGGLNGWVFRARFQIDSPKINSGRRVTKVVTCLSQAKP